MKRVAIYIRVSSDKQVQEGDSIATQRDALMRYIAEHDGMVLAGEYMDDGVSGQKFQQRDELQRLLGDVKEGKIDIILFTKMDRWFRSIKHYVATQELLDKAHVEWIAIWEPMYDTTTPQGRLIVNQMMSIAQFEAENTGQRIRQVQSYKVSRGEVISGSTPPGYTIRDKRMVPNEDADAVRKVFQHYSEHGNINETMRYASAFHGFPSSKPAFKVMLRNRKYTGEFRGNPDFCEPIISKELFEDVQRKLDMNIPISQKNVYLFSGLIVCGDCGKRMGSVMRTYHRQKGDVTVFFYRCTRRYNHGTHQCPNAIAVREPVLERRLLADITAQMEGGVEAVEESVRDESAEIDREIAALERKMARLKELYLAELISLDEYRTDRERFAVEVERLESKKKSLGGKKAPAFDGIGGDVAEVYGGLGREEKRQFWRSVVRRITVGNDREYHIEYV